MQNGSNMDGSYDHKDCIGLKIKPRKGDGLLFYSFFPNGTFDRVSIKLSFQHTRIHSQAIIIFFIYMDLKDSILKYTSFQNSVMTCIKDLDLIVGKVRGKHLRKQPTHAQQVIYCARSIQHNIYEFLISFIVFLQTSSIIYLNLALQ